MSIQNDTENKNEPTWEQMANRRNRPNSNVGNQRGSGGGRNNSGRQSGNLGNGRKRKKKDSDRWMNLFLVLLLLTIIVLAVLYFKKDKDEPADPVPTIGVQPGATQAPDISGTDITGMPLYPESTPDISQTDMTGTPKPPEKEEDSKITPTEPTSGAEEITPDPTDTPEPTNPDLDEQPTSKPNNTEIREEEANDILAGIFWEAGYRFTLSDSDFSKENAAYFRYDVAYEGKRQDYDVLVKKEDGDVYFYENGTIREFDGLPDHTDKEQGGEKEDEDEEITADLAAEFLKEIPYTSLGLPAPLDECSLALDNWKTVVAGEEAYCLNVFYQEALAGNIYFTENAEHIYYLDEFGEFVKVR